MAAVLAPVADTDPAVHAGYVDALDPPALMLAPSSPWLEPMTGCTWYARVDVLCVGGRVEPGAGLDEVERLIAYTLGRFADDPGTWPVVTVTAPRWVSIAAVTYLAARVTYRLPVTIEGT